MFQQSFWAKLIGAFILFTVTLIFTLLPNKLQRAKPNFLKTVSCFCGGLFLGLCFLHLIPDCIRSFEGVASLNKIQKSYPLMEFTICVGLIIVMTAEKLANFFKNRQALNKQSDASKGSFKDTCPPKETETTPLLDSYQSSYSMLNDSIKIDTDKTKNEKIIFNCDKPDLLTGNNDSPLMNGSVEKGDDITQSTKSSNSRISIGESRKQSVRAFCLVIALMVHSLFEGFDCWFTAISNGCYNTCWLLAFHKSIIGFSLGITIVKSNRSFRYHLKHATLFAVASPVGAIVGVIILSSKLHLFNEEAVALLSALSTGTFLFITFFEILAKDLTGNSTRDLVNFACFLVGLALFASISTIKELQA